MSKFVRFGAAAVASLVGFGVLPADGESNLYMTASRPTSAATRTSCTASC